MKVALAQIDTTVGDFRGNARRIVEWTSRAADRGAELVLFPELALCGYPPRDLVAVPDFLQRGTEVLAELAGELAGGPAALVGFVEPVEGARGLGRCNALAFLAEGAVREVARKCLLPNYDVFDERRHFDPAAAPVSLDWRGRRLGLSICEDLWNDRQFWSRTRYDFDPLESLVAAGCPWVLNASASPFHVGKVGLRRQMLSAAARRHGVGIALCNLVGGNDSLVFDGHSMVVGPDGELRAQAAGFEEELLVVDLDQGPGPAFAPTEGPELEQLRDALVLGLRDYVAKTGFEKVVVGLSGGIDSALTVALAVRALGPDRVLAVAMPSRFTSSMSDEDAADMAARLGIRLEVLPIEPMVQSFGQALSGVFGDRPPDVTEENVQARTRGVLLMAISNKLGHLLLTTGNKSELAVGYCTLYGDMCGGLNVIGDVDKTRVFALARELNREREIIPPRIIERPPSAELREDQKDEDSLPPYDRLDALLSDLVVRHRTTAELLERGHRRDEIEQVRRLLILSEYKRRQAAPCLRVSERAFGEGWRFPIAHRWRREHP